MQKQHCPIAYTNTFINKAICSEPLGGQSARRAGASIAWLW